jgi:hypothetical protein
MCCILKSPINPVTDPNPVCSHTLSHDNMSIMTWWLKAETVERGKHVSTGTNKHTTTEVLLESVFYVSRILKTGMTVLAKASTNLTNRPTNRLACGMEERVTQDSQSCETVKYCHESRRTQSQECLCWWGSAAICLTNPANGEIHHI